MSKRPNTSSPHPRPVEELIESFARLPGIGRRSAERLAFYLLRASNEEALRLSKAIQSIKKDVCSCSICSSLADTDPCAICTDEQRDASTVLVVEQPRDLISLELTGIYKGVYHVLMGRLDPLHGVGTEAITIGPLLRRIDDPASNSRGVKITEVILGLNPDLEGDTTALYLADELRQRGVKVTRLARGLPSGSQLEFASTAVLSDAIEGRQSVG
jgi:recombination protein RecR